MFEICHNVHAKKYVQLQGPTHLFEALSGKSIFLQHGE